MATWSSSSRSFEPFVKGEGSTRAVFEAIESAAPGAGFESDVGALEAPASGEETREQIEATLRAEMEATLAEHLEREDERLHALGTDLVEARQAALEEYARGAVRLALATARRILRREIELDPDALQAPLRAALWKIAEEDRITLRVHPEDAVRLRAHPGFLEEVGVEGLEEDRRIQRGGCVVQAGARGLDLRLESQLAEIVQAVDQALETP